MPPTTFIPLFSEGRGPGWGVGGRRQAGPVRDRRSRETQRPDKVEERKVFGGRREVEMEQRGEKASHSGPPRRPPHLDSAPDLDRPPPQGGSRPPSSAPSPTRVPTPASAAPTWAAHALPAAAPPPRRPPASSRGPGPRRPDRPRGAAGPGAAGPRGCCAPPRQEFGGQGTQKGEKRRESVS